MGIWVLSSFLRHCDETKILRYSKHQFCLIGADARQQAPSENVCSGKKFCFPGYSAAITATPELVFAGANDGYIRIYEAQTGEVLWSYDTVRDFTTVNGVVAYGGSMAGGAAPIADGGLLIVNSGYGFAGKMPGNVLLVFGAE